MKKKKYIFLFVLFIFLIIGITIIMSFKAEKKKIQNKLIYNSWNRVRDEFNSSLPGKYSGDPIPNTLIYFNETSVQFCNVEEEKELDNESEEILEEDDSTGFICEDYDYTIEDNLITVLVDDKKVLYTYEFNEKDELVLTYGDGYEFKFYYVALAG